MSGESFEESEISSTVQSRSFSTRISSSEEEVVEEPTSEEFRRSAELADEALAALTAGNHQNARVLAQNAIKLYSRNIKAYEALTSALTVVGEKKQALEVRLIVAQLIGEQNKTSGPFLELLPDFFTEFGDSRSFLVCVKFIFRYARGDEVKERFIEYLERTYGNQLRASSQIAIREYFAKSLENVEAALEAANDSTKAEIYARAVEFGDQYDDACLDFCRRNLRKAYVQRLLNLLYIKHKNNELAMLLAIKSVGIDDRVAQALSGTVGTYVLKNASSISDFSDPYSALIFNYFDYLIEIAPRTAREALSGLIDENPSKVKEVGSFDRIKLLVARADFNLRDCKSASKILKEIMEKEHSLDVLVRARLLSADILQFLNLHQNLDKVLLATTELEPEHYSIAITQASPRSVDRIEVYDFQYFYSPDSVAMDPLKDVRFRVRLGLHVLERQQDLALELLYLPVMHAISIELEDLSFLTTLQEILAGSFRCNYCKKIFSSAVTHEDSYVEVAGIYTFEHIYEIRRMLLQAGLQQIIYKVADLLETTSYHSEKCRNLRQLAFLYVLRCNEKSANTVSLSEERTEQFENLLLQRARELNYGRLIYADLRMALSKNILDKSSLFQFIDSIIAQGDAVLHENAYRFIKRMYVQNPENRDVQIAKLYLSMQKRTLSVKNAETALELYTLTKEPQFLYIRALFMARHCHTKVETNMREELFECCECLQNFLRICGEISGLEAAYAWYAVGTLLMAELGQISEAERIFRFLLSKRAPGNYDDAFDPEPDTRLRYMSAHQLSLCYMYMGNFAASIMVRRRYFTIE